LPISLPAGLPAGKTLRAEGLDVLDENDLRSWGRRPLRVCLVNLMPNKPATEVQIARLLAATPVPVELSLCLPDGYSPKSTAPEHLLHYRPWSVLRHEGIDALIVTGAPIEELAFEQVTYWPGLCAILDWARAHPVSSLYICWAAQAALYRYHSVAKHLLPEKLFGVFGQHVVNARSPLMRGFSETFPVPVSRHTEVREAELPADAALGVLAASDESGLCLVEDQRNRAVFMFNHLEYEAGTLRDEFLRDRQAARSIAVPRNYFPADDPCRQPANVWRSHGQLLFANWLAEICRSARPRVTDEPQIQWTLSLPRSTGTQLGDIADLLVSVPGGSTDFLPVCLRKLEAMGLAPHALKVHRDPKPGLLIEIRMTAPRLRAIENVAQRLCSLPSVASVAYRTADASGWCVARRGSAAGGVQAANSPGTLSGPLIGTLPAAS